MQIRLEYFFILGGVFLIALALRIALDSRHARRWGSSAFWLLLGVVLAAGEYLPAEAAGYCVIVMTILAAAKQVAPPAFAVGNLSELSARARTLGNRLLWPMLLVPAVAIIGGFALARVTVDGLPLVDPAAASQVALGIGCVLGFGAALLLTRERPIVAVDEGGRLIQIISWTLLLPPLLAALGGILDKAGVGEEVAYIVAKLLPVANPLVAVVAYCAGMALFTMMMGNAFAAFPVITTGIGIPFIVKAHGGDPAIMGTLGMLSGYCGTLITPMAANFNIVPVRLLELSDDYAVIKAQAPYAAAIFLFNVTVMYLCVYQR